MASTISQPALIDTRPYFCHQCSHQWMKSANALFQCPRCNEGFIEEVTADFQPRAPSPELPHILTLVNDYLRRGRVSPTEAATRNPVTGSSGSSRGSSTGSRTPRTRSTLSIVVGTSNRAGNEANANNGNDRDIRIRFGLEHGGGFFTFPIDEVMNTLFTNTPRQPAMTDNQLEEIAKATITADDVAAQTQCAICFEDYALNELDVRKLPCTHLFHEKCIFPWLKANATCPVCRSRMPNANNNEDEENSDIDDAVFDSPLFSRLVEVPLLNRVQRANADIPTRQRPQLVNRRAPRSRRIQQQQQLQQAAQDNASSAAGPSTSGIQSQSRIVSPSTRRANRTHLTRQLTPNPYSLHARLQERREARLNELNNLRERYMQEIGDQLRAPRQRAGVTPSAGPSNQATPSHIASRTRSRLDRSVQSSRDNNTEDDGPPRRRRRRIVESSSSSSSSD